MILEDDLLVQRCINGDRDAFGVLVDKYKDAVCGLAYSKVRNFHDAEDIAQEAFIDAYRSLPSLRHPHRFSSWIYTIVANRCRMWARKRHRESIAFASMDEPELKENLRDQALRENRKVQVLDSVLDAINGLPESSRLVMTLYYINGLTCKEIGEFTGTSINTIMSKLRRARARLMREFDEVPAQAMAQRKVQPEFTTEVLRAIEHISPVTPWHSSPITRTISIPWVLGIIVSLMVIAGISYISPPVGLDDLLGREESVAVYLMDEIRIEEPGDEMVTLIKTISETVLKAEVVKVQDLGATRFLDVIRGRDGGHSARFGDRSVWVFGDTFLSSAGQDGSNWRSSTWCWTQDFDARDGIGSLDEPVDVKGAPGEFLPFTRGELVYNKIHNLQFLPKRLRSRWALWPGPVVVSPQEDKAYVFYTKALARSGILNFQSAGSSIALWEAPDKPVVRPKLRPGEDDPTILFPKGDVTLGQGALVVDDWLYAYGCESGELSWPCIVARVRFADALKRDAWEFFAGEGRWSVDWTEAVTVMDAAPALSVHWNEYLGKYLAIYSNQLANTISIRTADQPEGTWSDSQVVVDCVVPSNSELWSYSGMAHPEFARDNGRVEYLTYYRETGSFTGEIRLVELLFR
jgi:RNA polymerase sigma factor (sigma-70 family)